MFVTDPLTRSKTSQKKSKKNNRVAAVELSRKEFRNMLAILESKFERIWLKQCTTTIANKANN